MRFLTRRLVAVLPSGRAYGPNYHQPFLTRAAYLWRIRIRLNPEQPGLSI